MVWTAFTNGIDVPKSVTVHFFAAAKAMAA
jgi:hypothetical protein